MQSCWKTRRCSRIGNVLKTIPRPFAFQGPQDMLQWINDRMKVIGWIFILPLALVFAVWGVHGLVDFTTRQVRAKGALVDLTPTEYVLLELLARNAGTVVPQQVLLERVWGREHAGDVHYLKVFVNRLRKKLGDSAARPRYIETRRGIGYRFVSAH